MTKAKSSSTNKHGIAALLLYLPHAIWLIAHGEVWDLFWMCDVAMPVLVFGAFSKNARAVVTAFLFLLYGTPVWLLDLAFGGSMTPTSPLIHIGGPCVAFLAIRRLGWPSYSWVVASGASAVVLAFSRFVAPPSANVNMAFRVYAGWEKHFANHAVYLAGLWLSASVIFYAFERSVGRRHLRTQPP